jgi:hypothetical protein
MLRCDLCSLLSPPPPHTHKITYCCTVFECALPLSTYAQVKLTGDKKTSKESYKTPVIKGQANPRWFGDNKFTLYDVTSRVSEERGGGQRATGFGLSGGGGGGGGGCLSVRHVSYMRGRTDACCCQFLKCAGQGVCGNCGG